MSKNRSSLGRRMLHRAGRFLFPLDTPRTDREVNTHRIGDVRTRQYKDTGHIREITGAELRRARQRDENWRRQ